MKLYKPKTIEEARHATVIIEQKHKFRMSSFKKDEGQQQYSRKKRNKQMQVLWRQMEFKTQMPEQEVKYL